MNSLQRFCAFQTVYSENKTFLVFSVRKKEAINYSQVQTLVNEAYREYFLPFQCTKTANTNKIGYDISGLTSLSEYLKSELRQEQYFEIISGIQKTISFCHRSHFSTDNLVCDPKYMYFHNISRKILMIYLPLMNQHYVCDDIPGCLNQIHKSAKNIIISDGNYMNQYEKYLSSFEGRSGKNGVSCFTPDSLVHFFNSNQMNSLDISREAVQENTAEPAKNPSFSINEQIVRSSSEPQVSVNDFENSGNTVVRIRKTEICLVRENGDRFMIDHFPYHIGRKQKNDMVIAEPTISGEHAVITEQGGKFFVQDTSSNGTFLNDKQNKISYAELKSGDKLFFDSICCTFSVMGSNADEEHGYAPTTVIATGRQETAAKDTGKVYAYLTKLSDQTTMQITGFPFQSAEIAGMVLTSELVGDRKALFLENLAEESMYLESLEISSGRKAELFSGCTITAAGEKYSFRIDTLI